jgi:hypothetical protein
MGGSGYNVSLAAGRSVRRHASARTPVWFWLEGPLHVYDMGCGPDTKPHEFRSRTPLLVTEDDPEGLVVWCGQCLMFRYVGVHETLSEATGLPTEDLFRDKRGALQGVAIEQDNNVLRERVGRVLQARGFVHTDEEIAAMAVEFGLPVAEIKKINAGLSAPESGDGPELCRAGLHEMTLNNVYVTEGKRKCRLCRNIAQNKRRAAKKVATGHAAQAA